MGVIGSTYSLGHRDANTMQALFDDLYEEVFNDEDADAEQDVVLIVDATERGESDTTYDGEFLVRDYFLVRSGTDALIETEYEANRPEIIRAAVAKAYEYLDTDDETQGFLLVHKHVDIDGKSYSSDVDAQYLDAFAALDFIHGNKRVRHFRGIAITVPGDYIWGVAEGFPEPSGMLDIDIDYTAEFMDFAMAKKADTIATLPDELQARIEPMPSQLRDMSAKIRQADVAQRFALDMAATFLIANALATWEEVERTLRPTPSPEDLRRVLEEAGLGEIFDRIEVVREGRGPLAGLEQLLGGPALPAAAEPIDETPLGFQPPAIESVEDAPKARPSLFDLPALDDFEVEEDDLPN